jgi:predicted ATPase
MGAGFAQFGWIAMQLEIARMPRFLLNPESPPPTPLVAVEEPELHLHPRLQPAMASMLAEFAMRDGQVVCSTQSEHFLLAVLELVAEQTLKPQDVSVYYLDAEHGVVDRLDVDQKGQMKGGLKGFFEENERQVERQIELLRKSADLGS